jgi:hypothetical protein
VGLRTDTDQDLEEAKAQKKVILEYAIQQGGKLVDVQSTHDPLA